MSEGGSDTSALKETDVGGGRGGQRGIQTPESFTFEKQDVCHTATVDQIQSLQGLNARHLHFQPAAGQLRKSQFKLNEVQLHSVVLRRSSDAPSQVEDKGNSFIPEPW